MKLKLDLENKILIPFMILTILPITILGIVSYWNGYQLLFNDRVKTQDLILQETVLYIEEIDDEVKNNQITLEEGKAKAIEYFQRANRMNMQIIDRQGYVLSNFETITDDLRRKIENSTKHMIDEKKVRYLFYYYENWDWTIIISIDKSFFLEELIEIQKYTMLLTIIFLVLSMQAIIFIAHHISKPIKYFAEVCKKIEIGNLKEKVDIQRGDEIGVLANSFNNMIDQINISTEKLIEMTKFNEDILKNIDIGIMTTDNNGKLISINKAGKEILKKYQDVNILNDLDQQTVRTVHQKRKINKIVSIYSETGKAIYIDARTSLLKKESGSTYGAICSFNDITDRKMLENNIVRVDRLASVGQFAAGLAHEIRNPLTGLKTGIQVIKNRELNRNEFINIELIDGITYEIDRINNLVSDLLDFSKPKQAIREKAKIRDIIKKSLDLAKEGIARKKVSINLEMGDKLFYVNVDKGQAEQIFLNIITNAIEAMESQGHLKIKTEYVLVENIPFIQTTFDDDGSGIEPEILEKIFDPFFTTKAKGTGLGLVVVAKLIEENNGKIEIESTLNIGTKIKVLLPEYWGIENENKSINH